jgi:hypothetical protein
LLPDHRIPGCPRNFLSASDGILHAWRRSRASTSVPRRAASASCAARSISNPATLDEFKRIYWWEWAHRLLGRLIGAAFLLPLLFFQFRGWD